MLKDSVVAALVQVVAERWPILTTTFGTALWVAGS
jgi:hypothetical protein